MIHTQRMGDASGAPALLAHCFLGNSGAWRGLVSALDPAPDALAFDLPGHGQSPMPADLSDLHASTAALIDGMVETPMLMIGHSFGGASMLRFALRNPDRVRAMVLFEPVFIAAAMADPGFTHSEPDQTYAIAAREGRLEEAARTFFTFNDPTRDWFALPPQVRATMIAQMRLLPGTEPGIVHDSGNLMEPGLMERFAPPVLLIAGDQSPPMFSAIIRELARRLPNVETVTIEGAGHMVPLTHARACADHIDRWRRAQGLV